MITKKLILIEPSYPAYLNDLLFTDIELNRDSCLEPIIRLKQQAEALGYEVHTTDFLLRVKKLDYASIDYYSFGIIPDFKQLDGVNLRAYLLMEPPVVQPQLYKQLPELTKHFEKVYLHNIEGDGYSLNNVDHARLRQLYWPQPFNKVIEPLWKNLNRKPKIVIINSKHKPKSFYNELYSRRMEAITELNKFNMLDLYGHGWDRLLTQNSLWMPYLKNYKNIISVYRGSCESKYQMLSEYQFCLCFENMIMKGYMTEKLFDCLYSGTIPIYLGTPDVEQYVPKEVYIDFRQFESYLELKTYLEALTDSEIIKIRAAGRDFIESKLFDKFYNSLERIIGSMKN